MATKTRTPATSGKRQPAPASKARIIAGPAKRQVPSLPPPPASIDPNQRYSLLESAAILRLAMATIYMRMQQKRIAVVRDGGRSYVLGSELIRYAAGSTSTGPTPSAGESRTASSSQVA